MRVTCPRCEALLIENKIDRNRVYCGYCMWEGNADE